MKVSQIFLFWKNFWASPEKCGRDRGGPEFLILKNNLVERDGKPLILALADEFRGFSGIRCIVKQNEYHIRNQRKKLLRNDGRIIFENFYRDIIALRYFNYRIIACF